MDSSWFLFSKTLDKASTVGFRAKRAVRPITGINTTEIPMITAITEVRSIGMTSMAFTSQKRFVFGSGKPTVGCGVPESKDFLHPFSPL